MSKIIVLFGLKGRFCQPRPKAWGEWTPRSLALKGPFVPSAPRTALFRADFKRLEKPRPSAWA